MTDQNESPTIPDDYQLVYFIRLTRGPYFRACFVPPTYDSLPVGWKTVSWRDLLLPEVSRITTNRVKELESQLAFSMAVEFRSDQIDGSTIGNIVRETYRNHLLGICWFQTAFFRFFGGMPFSEFVSGLKEDPGFQMFQNPVDRKLEQLAHLL